MPLTRRQFFRRAFWSATACGFGGAAYSTFVEPHRLAVTQHHLRLAGWPRALDGLTVAHLTDLHRSKIISRDYLQRCIARTNALQPDLLLVTGDYLTQEHYGDRAAAEALVADVADCLGQARARYGVFASLGNHDHWFDGDTVTRHLQNAGIPVLRNQNNAVSINGTWLPVIGLGDLWTEGVDETKAFAGVPDAPALVLMHNPDTFEHWSRPGSHLILSGHTHGGQVNLPLIGPPVVPSRYGAKYAHGLFRRDATYMYVSRGVGMISPGVRFNCRPEIAYFRLHCA